MSANMLHVDTPRRTVYIDGRWRKGADWMLPVSSGASRDPGLTLHDSPCLCMCLSTPTLSLSIPTPAHLKRHCVMMTHTSACNEGLMMVMAGLVSFLMSMSALLPACPANVVS